MTKKKILICDDEEGVRESLKLILSDRYQLLFAKTTDEALKAVGLNSDIKAVLLDIKMPKKNGIEVLKEIKSRNKNLPIIIVTGYQSIETATKAINEGALNYIVKPFDSKSILDAVQKVLP